MESSPSSSALASRDEPPSGLPPETRWLLWFQSCNSFNFTVALGSPMILTAKHLGATEFHIGLMTGMAPALAILQILATNLMDRIGYRRLMLAGWGTRSFMLLLIVPLPLLVGHVPSSWLVAGMILPIFLFNAVRGFASGAWLPWLHEVLPSKHRGLYFGLEQRTMNLSAFLTMIGCAVFFLGQDRPAWKFSAVFLAAWVAGMASVHFLRKMPERPPSQSLDAIPRRTFGGLLRHAGHAWAYAPFRRSTRFVILYTFALSSVPAFLVLYINERLGWKEWQVFVLQSLSPIGVLLTAVWFGHMSDRSGSRPLLRIAGFGHLGLIALWTLYMADIVHPSFVGMAITYLVWGFASSAHAVAQTRMVLASSPPEDVKATMSIFQVAYALSAGLAPVLCGKGIDLLKPLEPATLPAGTSFAIMFAIALAVGLVAQFFLGRVQEEHAVPAHRLVVQTLWDWPVRVIGTMPVLGRERRSADRQPKPPTPP